MAPIEVKKSGLTETEEAAAQKTLVDKENLIKTDENREKSDEFKNIKENLRDAQENIKKEAREGIEDIRQTDIIKKIEDRDTLRIALGKEIKDYPKSVPAFLDKIVEIKPQVLNFPGVSGILADQIQELLNKVGADPTLSRDRDWMDTLRHSISHLIIDNDLAAKLKEYGTMDEKMRKELQTQLGIENITQGLDQNTQDIVQKVYTGFYRFDPEVNTWVNTVGALVFLWPENIAGIEKYLNATLLPSLEKYKKDHPEKSETDFYEDNKQFLYLKRKDDHGIDSRGKYAIVSDGRPHNMMLAEADYLTQYLQKRGEGKDDTTVFLELGRTHVANLADNKAVQDSVKEFEKKYGDGSFNASPDVQIARQSREISRTVLPKKIPEYTRIKNLVELKKYEYIINEQRPEMKDIIYDIAAGFVRFDTGDHTFKAVTGQVLLFTEAELTMIDNIFQDKNVRPNAVFLKDTKIRTYSTTDRSSKQYDYQILRDRINFYKQ